MPAAPIAPEIELPLGADVEQAHAEGDRGCEPRERERGRRDERVRERAIGQERRVEQPPEGRPGRVTGRKEDDGDRRERDEQRAERDDEREPPVLDEAPLDANRGPAHRHARHQQPELVGRRCAGVPLTDDRALVHHDDPVCEHLHLVEVLADQEHRDTVRSRLPQVVVHGLDRADVESACRRGDDEHLRPPRELAPEDDLLQVPARQHACGELGPAAAHVVPADELDGALADPAEEQERPARDTAAPIRLEDDVRRDAEARRDAGVQPVLGDVRDARRDRLARVAAAQAAAVDRDDARGERPEARDRLSELALAVPRDAGDAEHLARTHLERDVANRIEAAVAGRGEAFRPEQDLADRASFAPGAARARCRGRPSSPRGPRRSPRRSAPSRSRARRAAR